MFAGNLNKGDNLPVMQVFKETTGELVYSIRLKGNTIRPWVFEEGKYEVRLGYPEKDEWENFNSLEIR